MIHSGTININCDTTVLTFYLSLYKVSSFFNWFTDGAKWLRVDISGEVTLISQLKADKIDITSHVVSVYAKDYSQPNCSLPGTLTITVSGVNDNDPEICYQGHCGDPDIKVCSIA